MGKTVGIGKKALKDTMIIIDKNMQIKKLLDEHDLSVGVTLLDEGSFEVSTLNTHELYIVHEDYLLNNEMTERLKACAAIVIFAKSLTNDLSIKNLKVVAVINESTPKQLLQNQIKILSELCSEKEFLRSQLVSLNAELNDALSNVELEMLKVKRMYEKAVPRRIDNIKGMSFFSKYAAGENSGGEFFDLFREKNKVLVIASATTSYLASSTLISLFTAFKQDKSFSASSLKVFISSLEEEIKQINESRHKAIGFDLFVGVFDTNKGSLNGHIFGNFNLLSDHAQKSQMGNNLAVKASELKNSAFLVSMERGERFLLVSPGLLKNWEELSVDFHFETLLRNKEIKPTDVIDEIFFQLKKDRDSAFLVHDASILMMEIDTNAMVEV